MSILGLYNKLGKYPLGNYLFSRAVCFKAPYFGTVSPVLQSMESGKVVVTFKRRRGVQNHIGTVHVIAICNALEMAMGMCAEATIPTHLRWLPKSMSVQYPAKSSTRMITAVATVDPAAFQADCEVPVKVTATRDDGTVVVEGEIVLWVTAKPAR